MRTIRKADEKEKKSDKHRRKPEKLNLKKNCFFYQENPKENSSPSNKLDN